MIWLAIVAVGLGSYVLRVAPLVLLPRSGRRSASIDAVARHAGTAALSALVVSSVVHRVELGDGGPTLAAVGVALLLALREVPMLVVVVVGLLVAWAAGAIGPW